MLQGILISSLTRNTSLFLGVIIIISMMACLTLDLPTSTSTEIEPLATQMPRTTVTPTSLPINTRIPTESPEQRWTPMPTLTPAIVMPLIFHGWEGVQLKSVCLEMDFSFPDHRDDARLRSIIRCVLEELGIQVDPSRGVCDAVLTVDITGTALAETYNGAGRCYEGMRVSGEVSLAAEGKDSVRLPVEVVEYPPVVILWCNESPSDAYFGCVCYEAVSNTFSELWGPLASDAIDRCDQLNASICDE